MVWRMLQLPAVKVRLAGLTVAASASSLDTATVTASAGWCDSSRS